MRVVIVSVHHRSDPSPSNLLATVFDFFPKERKRERRRKGGEKKKKRRRKERRRRRREKRRREERRETKKQPLLKELDLQNTFLVIMCEL